MAASVSDVSPLQTLAIAFLVGGMLSWWHRPTVRWRPVYMLAGCIGLFGSHLLYFVAMSLAPAAQVVVINYTWPLMMVVAAPLFRLPGSRWSPRVLAAAVIGFGAVVTLVWDAQAQSPHSMWGSAAAFGSAVIWCGFSMAQAGFKAFGDYPLGPAMLLSGVLSGALLLASGSWITPTLADSVILLLIGIGPMGAAFMLWAMALRHGDAQWLGVIANISPVVSVALLTMLGIAEPSARLFWAAIGIAVAGLLIGSRSGTVERNASSGSATRD